MTGIWLRSIECEECGGEALQSPCSSCIRSAHEAEEAAFMRLVSGQTPHECRDYRLADGDCEVCWLARK